MNNFNKNMNSNLDKDDDSLNYVENNGGINNKSSEFENKKVYKKLDDKEEKDNYITSSMKKFRTLIGVVCLATLGISMFGHYTAHKAIKDNLTSGIIENVSAGEILSTESLSLEARDENVKIADGYGNLEIQVWNFVEKEDYDYVQVFINGTAEGAPFAIRHKPVKISVPDKAVITVQGVRDGSNNGITYGVSFNKTGETYLNSVNLNGTNSYTIISD